jgi:oligoribonuclease NrnB/cAMP/cGMP phosphodiesterase (DHH superfamily)
MKTIKIPNEHIFTSVSVNGEIVENLKTVKVKDYWIIINTEDNYQKIIASTKFIDKSIPVIKFIEQSVEDFNLENSQKFAEKYFDNLKKKYPQGGQIKIDNILSVLKVGVECGYKFGKKYQAKSSDKKYTEKQLEDAITIAFDISEYGIFNSERDKYKNKIIQSLNQSKLPDVINLEAEEYCQLLKSKNTSLCLRCQFLHPECYKLKTKSTPEGEIIEIKI